METSPSAPTKETTRAAAERELLYMQMVWCNAAQRAKAGGGGAHVIRVSTKYILLYAAIHGSSAPASSMIPHDGDAADTHCIPCDHALPVRCSRFFVVVPHCRRFFIVVLPVVTSHSEVTIYTVRRHATRTGS